MVGTGTMRQMKRYLQWQWQWPTWQQQKKAQRHVASVTVPFSNAKECI